MGIFQGNKTQRRAHLVIFYFYLVQVSVIASKRRNKITVNFGQILVIVNISSCQSDEKKKCVMTF